MEKQLKDKEIKYSLLIEKNEKLVKQNLEL